MCKLEDSRPVIINLLVNASLVQSLYNNWKLNDFKTGVYDFMVESITHELVHALGFKIDYM